VFFLFFFNLAFVTPMYEVLGAESCSGGDTLQPAASQSPIKKLHVLLQQVFYIQW
jgi:hypothetical protein